MVTPGGAMDIVWQMLLLVAGAILGVVATRLIDRWFSPLGDHELWVDYSAYSLAAPWAQKLAPNLRYQIGDTQFSNPYYTRVYLWRAGAKDVPPTSFSGDLEIRLRVQIAPETIQASTRTGTSNVDFLVDEKDATVLIAPSIIRPDFVAIYEFVSDGEPQIQIHSPVADLRVTSFVAESLERNRIRPFLAWTGGVLLVVGILCMIGGAVLAAMVGGPNYFGLGLIPAVLGVMSIAASADALPRRARMARRTLRARSPGALREPYLWMGRRNRQPLDL